MMRMKARHKRFVSLVLVLAMLFSLNVSDIADVKAQTTQPAGAEKNVMKTAANTDVFAPMYFSELYDAKKITCAVDGVTLDADEVDDGLLVSGENQAVSGAAIVFTDNIDFGTEAVSRIQINALAKRATKTYFQLYVDDATAPLVEYRLENQSQENNWNKQKIYCYEFPKKAEKLTGRHKITIRLVDTTTKKNKETQILLRSLQFIQGSVPVVSFDLDEEMGTVSDMNNDPEHAAECYGKMKITVPDGYAAEYGENPEQIAKDTAGSYDLDYVRGRGNSTWSVPKKPYKVKLDKKADLFGMGANKHWVLLANYYDNSLLRNRLTYYLGKKLGMEYTPEMVPVDVIMNHEYLGSYYLCEQIRLGENRVDLTDLEAALEDADVSGGYLLSMSPYGDETEYVASTSRGNEFLVESPAEGLCLDEATEYIEEYLQKTEDAIYGENFKLKDGTSYKDLMDVQSAVAYYWMQEFSMNGDAFISTSTYLYKKQDTEEEKGKLYWGPLWDFDYVAWSSYDYSMSEDSYSGFMNQRTWFSRLMEDEEFAAAVKEYWKTKFKPQLQAAIAEGGILDQYADEMRVSATNNFNKWGYFDFGGWDYYDDEENDDVAGSLTFDEEVERLKDWTFLRMEWIDENLDAIAPTPITLTFKNDGKVYKTVTAMSGREIESLPSAPEAPEGYVFGGWYYKDVIDGEETELRAYPYDIYMDDTEFTAKWLLPSEVVMPESVQLERTKLYAVRGEMIDFNYVVLPFNVTDDTVTIESSNEEIVGMESDYDDEWGNVWVAKDAGTATLTVTTVNGKKATCEIVVVDWEELWEHYSKYMLEDFSIDKTSITLKKGEAEKINLSLTPETAIVRFYWQSTNPEVVKVEAGTVMAVGEGKAFVIVSSNADETEKMQICEVNVTGDKTTASPSPTPNQTTQPTNQPPRSTQKPEPVKKFNKGNLKYRVNAGSDKNPTVAVTGVVKAAKKVVIPATVKYNKTTYKVTGIASKAFAKDKKLTNVVIGKNVTTIDASAFKNCKKLKTVQIKTTKCKKIGKNAFAGLPKKAVFQVPKKKLKAYKKMLKGKKVKGK